ncbi:MAG: metal ABC transporter substrate-binding protein [Bifidobacteriaceae bacterium]|jgi:zinc transport system substrate-binding protein|nr:metal ABC transporter substrate-binding protein [Bifidobacteriaceae bacterium]
MSSPRWSGHARSAADAGAHLALAAADGGAHLTLGAVTRGARPARRRAVRFLAAAGAAAAALALTACGTSGSAGGAAATGPGSGLTIVTAFYPLQWVSENVALKGTKVTSLTPSGAEPHDLELSPSQVSQIRTADVVVYIKGFQPSVDKAVQQAKPKHAIDVAALPNIDPMTLDQEAAAGITQSDGYTASPSADPAAQAAASAKAKAGAAGLDPHLWLDPNNLVPVAGAVARALTAVDKAHAATYDANANTLGERLGALSTEFSAGLQACASTRIVTTHAAFGYLSKRYGLVQLSVGGLDPEAEPSLQRIRTVAASLKGSDVTTVFFEETASPDIAETLAKDDGLKAERLDPIETSNTEGDYIARMRTDLKTLEAALQCH